MPGQVPSRAGEPAKTQLLEFVRPVTQPGASFVP
jgi:hypothetical protein